MRARGLKSPDEWDAVALTFAEPVAKAYQNKCIENGVLVNATDDNSIRMVPPLIVGAADIEQAHDRLKASLPIQAP